MNQDKQSEVIERLRELLARATPGPWQLQDGCSWRRIGTAFHDGDVLCPSTYSRDDHHPDLTARDGRLYDNLRLIVEAINALPALLEALSRPSLSTPSEGVIEQLHSAHQVICEAVVLTQSTLLVVNDREEEEKLILAREKLRTWLDSYEEPALSRHCSKGVIERVRAEAFEEAAKVAIRMQEAAWPRLEKDHDADAATQADTAMEIAEAIQALARLSPLPLGEEGRERRETFETINDWCDRTFGPATLPRIIERAKEEFEELEAESDPEQAAIEAADVVICLCRVPGFAEALQRKMAINRARKWRLTGEGTGYHIPQDAPALSPAKAIGG